MDRLPGDMPKFFKNPSYETAMAIKRLLSTTSSVITELHNAKPDAFSLVQSFAELRDLVNRESENVVRMKNAVDEQQWSYDALEVSKANFNQHSRDLVRCSGCHKILFPQFFAAHHGILDSYLFSPGQRIVWRI